MIKQAVAVERNTSNLADAIYGLAMLRGVHLSSKQNAAVCKFIQEYVEHAPALLEKISSAAKKAGIYKQVRPILEAAEEYFFAPVDIIPDQFGLLGLVDDAYLTHSLIQALSDSYRDETGNTLLPVDLTNVNQFIRGLIGEPQGSMLDVGVANTLNSPLIQESLLGLLDYGAGFDMTGPDPIWGNATMDEIVDARLGGMGYVR
jgi:uncharacterized membrane protein YkvA (DUF1232 family)